MSDAEITTILHDRGKQYGAYLDNAHLTQRFKTLLRNAANFHQMPDYIREGFEMVLHKIARAANGDPMVRDNVLDAIGYLMLVLEEMDKDIANTARAKADFDRARGINGNTQTR